MTTCMICTNTALAGLPLTSKDQLGAAARTIIQGIRQGVPDGIKAPRLGTCMVERCAQLIEEACAACTTCPRCAIAGELRAAEGRLNTERDAELVALSQTDEAVYGIIDQFVEGLCALHAPLGVALIEARYGASPAGMS